MGKFVLIVLLAGCCAFVSALKRDPPAPPSMADAPEERQCTVDADKREDCGYYGIKEDECVNDRRCCWVESDKAGVPWCFFEAGNKDEQCDVAGSEREECGYYGIQRYECEREKGCCWDTSVENVPWCFQKPTEGSGSVESTENPPVIN